MTSAAVFGDLVRSCFDLFRGDLLTYLGWPLPEKLSDERALWGALGQQLYRRGTSSQYQDLINAPRTQSSSASQDSDHGRPGRLRQFLNGRVRHKSVSETAPRLEPRRQKTSSGSRSGGSRCARTEAGTVRRLIDLRTGEHG